MDEFCELLQQKSALLGITLSPDQLAAFEKFYELLIEKNKVMNLTAITDWKEVIDKHFIDSMSLSLCSTCFNGKGTLIDVGTGAGFPGIPLKILYPELEVTCMDSLNKRIDFLNEVIEQCGLKGIRTVHSRAEDLGRDPKFRNSFDFAVSRAVANLSVLSEYCTPFLKKGGLFISYKSGEIEEELKESGRALKLLQCETAEVQKFTLPGTELHRSFVIIRKKNETPSKYPRKAGTPGKQPL